MKKIFLEQKGHPPTRASLEEVTFHTFPYKRGELFKLQKVGLPRRVTQRVTHLVQSPFCNGRVSLLAGPTFLHKHIVHFPFIKNSSLKFSNLDSLKVFSMYLRGKLTIIGCPCQL